MQLPAWATAMVTAYDSGAHNQFILTGNVSDRLLLADGRSGGLERFLIDRLLPRFAVVLTFDPGNGLRVERGNELFSEWSGGALPNLPREARQAVELITRYVRYLNNLSTLGRDPGHQVAVVVRSADLILPADGRGAEAAALACLVRDWASEDAFTAGPFASLLIADNLNDLHPLVARNPRAARFQVPLPAPDELARALAAWKSVAPVALSAIGDDAPGLLAGMTLSACEAMVRRHQHEAKPLTTVDLLAAKRAAVERDCEGLVEFLTPGKTLADYHGQPALLDHLRTDLSLWRSGDLAAMPMGYLLCGPVGTGKTYLVNCLAGEAGVPVVVLKNFRDKWVGSSEGNLERIFRLVHALGRCMVFIDEADQALGKRDAGGNDGGLSGRLYSMIAQEMSDPANRGRVLWVLASSRPDLIEVDLKRPGRIDVKVPLLPTATEDESRALLTMLCRKRGLELGTITMPVPIMLTPGAAEAVAVRAYRLSRTRSLAGEAALIAALDGWRPPVPPAVLEEQMRLAIREATDIAVVPEAFRGMA